MIELLNIILELLFDPRNAFKKIKQLPTKNSIAYLVIILFIYHFLNLIFSPLAYPVPISISLNEGYIVFEFAVILYHIFVSAVNVLIASIILHLFVYLLSGKERLEQTIKISIYSLTPYFLFGWIIPYLAGKVSFLLVVSLWGILILYSSILGVIGLIEIHDLSIYRAIAVLFLPVLILLAIFLIIILFLKFYLFSNLF